MASTSAATTFTRFMIASSSRLEEGETIRGASSSRQRQGKAQEGEVIAVGKGKSNDEGKVFPLDVKAGDKILFGKYSGTEIKLDGQEFLIMREEEFWESSRSSELAS